MGRRGLPGLILGGAGATALSDEHGFTRRDTGVIYARFPTGNPLPNGIPYTYRSLDINGNDCDKNCASYEIKFVTEGKIGDLLPGLHIVTPLGILLPEGARGLARPEAGVIFREGLIVVSRETLWTVQALRARTKVVLDNPSVERIGGARGRSLFRPLFWREHHSFRASCAAS